MFNSNSPVAYSWFISVLVGLCFALLLFIASRGGYRIIWLFDSKTKHCNNNECLPCKWRRPRTWRESISRLLDVGYWSHLEWHPLICLVGTIVGLCWIYAISAEIIGVLKALGKTLHVSDGIMGVTVFALGNSVGDLATNLMIAKLGFYSMATGACMAGPMMSMFQWRRLHDFI